LRPHFAVDGVLILDASPNRERAGVGGRDPLADRGGDFGIGDSPTVSASHSGRRPRAAAERVPLSRPSRF